MRIAGEIFVLSLLFAVWGNSGVAQPRDTAISSKTLGDTLLPRELPLPEIPSTLRSAPERAAYVVTHFWDDMDFRDTLCARDTAFMEQNFVNFIALFPHAESTSLQLAVRDLMRRAEVDPVAYTLMMEIAEKYLYESASPMLNEEYFIFFLEEIVRTPVLGEYDKMRPVYLLEAAKKNRPGMKAADFTYFTRDGRRQTLYATKGRRILLIFYDPDCDHCQKMMEKLQGNEFLRQQIHAERLTVLAIYADNDRKAWNRTKNDFPTEWIVGLDGGDIRERELYVMSVMPTLYLLDRNKKVVLKEVPLQTLLGVLADDLHR
ncbi:DUF5106 domain-containing protein [uncultured Sanguibacteroides sp.]|uniref:DUF5106 domain-containing protein n=1 Tax=uncultured Sanguibacteroides sp. TaxID=1635151 RepID=UPI0025CDD893|nr:DUF5106 domain-containing protein [uncultured Sanguibacteroides sp.]